MTIRRIFFILLIHFFVMVCFPHYGMGGFSYGVMSAIVWSIAAILVGLVITVLGMENWRRVNLLITLALICVCAWFTLQRFPQESKVTPLKRLAYGDFPTKSDVEKGLSAFGIKIGSAKDWVDNTKETAKKMNDFQKRADKAMESLND
ncbi:hypothetical protein AAIR98_000806 [Elusimicrobium simillimum]|uniref:hypothetical protein n=1 Tax=Elusimicrobium simillimum TaxID=3143438 RepID=UPI003C700951